MFCFNKIALAVAFVFAVGSANAGESKSMFKDPPSIVNSNMESIQKMNEASILNGAPKTETNQSFRVEKLKDGRTSISTKIHGPKGVPFQIVIPQIQPEVTFDGPAGVNENGRPITWKQRRDRKIANAIVFNGLKAYGYDYEEHKKTKQGQKTQLDVWKEKTEETRRYIQEHGPITTKDFIVPGSTPELSAQLNNDEVGVRKENGKLVYYLHGKKLNIYPEEQKITARESQPISSVKTRVKRSKRVLTEEQKEQLEKQKKLQFEKPALKDIPKESPKKVYEVPPSEDLRRDPLDIKIDPEKLPSVDDVTKQVEQMFPDMGKVSFNKSTEGNGNSLMPSLMERVAVHLLGVRDATAADADADISIAETLRKTEEFADIANEIQITPSKVDTQEFQDAIKSISDSRTEIVNSVKRDLQQSEDETLTLVDAVNKEGDYYDPAVFAAEVVNRTTKSLTPEQYDEDVEAIINALSSNGSNDENNVLNALRDILLANPEIYNEIPDADERLQELRNEILDVELPNPHGEQTLIFVSYSLSDEVLLEIMENHAKRDDVTLVMQGVPKGMRIDNGLRKIQELAAKVESSATIVVDPPLFDAYQIRQVPAVVRVGKAPSAIALAEAKERKHAPMIAKVTGLHNDKWLMEQIEKGERGDLGIQGEVKEIAEPNLIDVMKERVANIDWGKKKEEAIKRFWKNQTFKDFPMAEFERVREIDPTFFVERDLTDLAGRAIRKAGDRINPLEIRPFTQTLLIFNPLSEEEIERVKAFQTQFKEKGKLGLVLIATKMAKDNGWESYKTLTDSLDSHVFMLTPEVEHQWRIEKTPTVVTADNQRHVFLVKELGPVDSEKVE